MTKRGGNAREVWKHRLGPDWNFLHLPEGAEVLSVGYQDQAGGPVLWESHDVENRAKTVERRFCLVGTGFQYPEEYGSYVGTTVTPDGLFVFHVFEAGQR
jgi:hypothetical protein